MEKNNPFFKPRNRVVLLFYRVAMPSISLLLLFGASSLIDRPLFMGSRVIDILVRVTLIFWFITAYMRLPNLTLKYRFYPNMEFKKTEISVGAKIFYISLAIIFSFGIVLVTWWTLNTFLPTMDKYSVPIAVINGLIFMIPLTVQYQVFRI